MGSLPHQAAIGENMGNNFTEGKMRQIQYEKEMAAAQAAQSAMAKKAAA